MQEHVLLAANLLERIALYEPLPCEGLAEQTLLFAGVESLERQ